tara:strand:+ start:89983 stop:91134 length:1152 start_codon:yes stop_codon:yes gene_type:complete
MEIREWYKTNFEARLQGRYVTLEVVLPIVNLYKDVLEISSAGTSEEGKDIPLLKLGSGEKVVFGWSQMHGNESTTTKAIFDFLRFVFQKEVFQKEVQKFLSNYTFYIIPILNPDGAKKYTRVNANEVDLNRDASSLSQSESKVLRKVFEKISPDLCLNLHDQRSIYGLESGMPATVSFLAPAANKRRSITKSRKIAMEHIVKMFNTLEGLLPGQTGRYDDTFNNACVGDTFQQLSVPTILFEAGHHTNDYEREKTRELIFYALLSLFQIIDENDEQLDYKKYFEIPENKTNYRDVLIKNVNLEGHRKPVDVGIQFVEELRDGQIQFTPTVDGIEKTGKLLGHRTIDLNGSQLLVNSQRKIKVGQKVSTIVKEEDNSIIILQEK